VNKRISLAWGILPALLLGLFLVWSSAYYAKTESSPRSAPPAPAWPTPQPEEESEPNDSMTTANSIEPYDTMLGQIPFTPTLDVDWYRLLLLPSEIGLRYGATLKQTNSDPPDGLGLGVFDADGGLIDFSSYNWPVHVYWTSTDITHYLQVTVRNTSARLFQPSMN